MPYIFSSALIPRGGEEKKNGCVISNSTLDYHEKKKIAHYFNQVLGYIAVG